MRKPRKPKVTRFRFNHPEAQGNVSVYRGPYGLNVDVKDGKNTWGFMIDLFYLSRPAIASNPGGRPSEMPGRCVQVVIYEPDELESDPIRHVRVFPDGRLEDSIC